MLGIEIIDKYSDYIFNDEFVNVSTQAWNKICTLYPFIIKYNYGSLHQNHDSLTDFLKMCETDKTKELDDLLTKYREQHSYEKFDNYFEKYLGMEELK